MKNHLKTESLPCLILGLGGAGCAVRLCLYLFGTDEKGLLISWHPLALLLWLLTAAVAVLILWSAFRLPVRPLTGPKGLAAVADLALAAGILAAFFFVDAASPLEMVCKILGVAAEAAMVWSGLCHLRSREPSFLATGLASLFFALCMVNAYRFWSGEPQLQDVVFNAAGLMLLALAAYYQAARLAGMGNEKARRAAALGAAFVCLTASAHTENTLLYAAGGVWAAFSLYSPELSAETEED